jgi:hypothetical protein
LEVASAAAADDDVAPLSGSLMACLLAEFGTVALSAASFEPGSVQAMLGLIVVGQLSVMCTACQHSYICFGCQEKGAGGRVTDRVRSLWA